MLASGACSTGALGNDCEDGTAGCPCYSDFRCDDSTEADTVLVCDLDICTSTPCAEGLLGCACLPDNSCTASGATCQGARCVTRNCDPGSLNCACAPGGNCAPGLMCHNGAVCIDATGFAGGGCHPNNTCNQANTCDGGVCVPCNPGDEMCGCYSNGACNPGLACHEGTCITEPSQVDEIPADPTCYSPCTSGLALADGTFVECSSEGLMEGCYGDTTCDNGSCTAVGVAPTACGSDVDCPDFQACIRGRCYSNCQFNSDCGGDLLCHKKVCRIPCVADADECPSTQVCTTVDGDNGHCMPLEEASGDEKEVTGDFVVTPTSHDFSNVRLNSLFRIINNSESSRDFNIRKVEHTEFAQTGALVDQTTPLFWLDIGPFGNTSQVPEVDVRIDGGGGEVVFAIEGAANGTIPRWDGIIEVSNPELGVRQVRLSYAERPDGRWTGKMYYFANFPADATLDNWLTAEMKNPWTATDVKNAFIHHWGGFRRGALTYDRFLAMLTSTETESWKWQSMRDRCDDEFAGGPNSVCFPADNAAGAIVYSDDTLRDPIPTGVTELPIAMNLTADTSDTSGATFMGKVVSGDALQYVGEPAVSITFAGAPDAETPCSTGACLLQVADFMAEIPVGGRYLTDAADSMCSQVPNGTFDRVATPWLVPGFSMASDRDPATGLRYRYECRDRTYPFGDSADVHEINLSLASGNPIPDGRTRVRRLELVDGALINQESLFIIFRESYDAFLGAGPNTSFSAYGYMVLTRGVADLDANAFSGSIPNVSMTQPTTVLDASCSQWLLDEILGGSAPMPGTPIPVGQLGDVASGVIDGDRSSGASAITLVRDGASTTTRQPHYWCEDTGLIDGGDLQGGLRVSCPPASRVDYFTTVGLTDADIAALDCQKDYAVDQIAIEEQMPNGSVQTVVVEEIVARGSCYAELKRWRAQEAANPGSGYSMQDDPVWKCTMGGAYCSVDREDLINEKTFYESTGDEPVFVGIEAAVDGAFRYKTRFRNRRGTSVGFAPEICIPDSEQIPYCYDPSSIEEIRERVDCALHLYVDRYDDLTTPSKDLLLAYLETNFAFDQVEIDPMNQPGVFVTFDGYERLFSELLIMMGDEAYTAAFASRFDLAGSNLRSFEGALFEPDGINLSGGAGYEMYNLYVATQYYQATLDRFYAISPLIWKSMELDADVMSPFVGFIDKDSVTSYFGRLIRASTQKSRAWSEVAKRYQSFNRPDLARFVIERAYTATYLESVILSRIMLRIAETTVVEDRPQIVKEIELASLWYRAAMLDMRDMYKSISDDQTFFGFAPDYIPFPAMDPGDTNAFEKLLASTHQRMATAAIKETEALQNNRSYETDSAVFQSELSRIRNNYENQLAEICGTFTGDDSRIYPAIPKYAYLNERARLLGNPCGFAGNGLIHQAMAALELSSLDLKSVIVSYDNVVAEIEIERLRVSAQCGLIADLADYQYSIQGRISNLQNDIRTSRFVLDSAKRVFDAASRTAGVGKCLTIAGTAAGSDCPTATIAVATINSANLVLSAVASANEAIILSKEDEIGDLQQQAAYWASINQCAMAQVDSNARMKTLALRLRELELEALKQTYRIKLGASEIQKLRNQATRTVAEQTETEQHTINVEAARNDPNVRIYKNDAILTADRTFNRAVREAYKLTKVYEYYTSQSYERLGNLFLVRMVGFGDISLETYVAELEDAFYEFEEQFGNPDLRVAILSLRDDVLNIPRVDLDGTALSSADRITMLRDFLTDPRRLDERGYLTMQFATSLSLLSPLTRNHKVSYLEAEVIGSDIGDTLGRVYLQQRGTGIVRTVDDGKSYFAFPERKAVLNPFFNGVRAFNPDVYRNDRLRDRPFVNTHWELVLNQRDELVNQDINLASVADVRIYLYYTDFTEL